MQRRWRCWWWWWWLVLLMTGGQCHRQKKMMGRGADGGCGTEERPCRPSSRFPVRTLEIQPENAEKQISRDIDLLSQARKALCERSPYDVPEDGSISGLSVPTLPSGLASFLKQSDSRKRHKKAPLGAEKKSSRQAEKPRGGNIWVETEEYFRDLALPDIDSLSGLCSFSSLAARKCFLIPYAGNEPKANATSDANVDMDTAPSLNANADSNIGMHIESRANVNSDATEGVSMNFSVNSGENLDSGNAIGLVIEGVKDEFKKEDEHLMETDSVGAHCLTKEEKEYSDSSKGLEWLLGCRSRALLTSERPSKKRKLLGSDAGLEKVLIGFPCDGNSSFCHFCCTGETRKESNRLIVCSSCKVAVHQKCYGVQGDVDSSWICCWCKQNNNEDDREKPCVLCPKQGGALKPIHKSVENIGSVEFTHLFCALWMPEVYIEGMKNMEPIINVGGIKETRKKMVCNVCKVKCGACVRCSHGTCRAAFHPICAREARHRMEVWGKYGCDNVELRAFCSKHSAVQDHSISLPLGDNCAASSDSSVVNQLPVTVATDNAQTLKTGLKNGDNIAVHVETPDASSDKSGDSESQEIVLVDSTLNGGVESESCDAQQSKDVGLLDRSNFEDISTSDSLNLALILRKLIDRGKVDVKDVASELGISPDSLSAMLVDESLASDTHCKILKWLRNHAYLGTSQMNRIIRIKSLVSSKAGAGAVDSSDDVMVTDSDITDPVAVKSVPPRRRTKSNVRILDRNATYSSDSFFNENGILKDEVKADKFVKEVLEDSSKESIPVEMDKSLTKPDGSKDSSLFPKSEGCLTDPANQSISESCQSEEASVDKKNSSFNADEGNPFCSTLNSIDLDLIKTEETSSFYVHPYICKKLSEMQSSMFSKKRICEVKSEEDTLHEIDGLAGGDVSRTEASCNASVCCNHQSQDSRCNDMICKSDGVNLEQLVKARNLGLLEFTPKDEVEGEIIYYQHRLLCNAVARNRLTDNLVDRVAKSLPQEIEASRRQRWDVVLVNQYLNELREAKKQGRKERRHKEAQAVLAAATAAAAASSRISSTRKDALEDPGHQENVLKLSTSGGRIGVSSQLMPRAKETLSRVAVPRTSSEKYSDFVFSVSDFSKEHPRSCDICRRSETMLNPILVCSSCKVAVHLDCYRNVKETTGPWCCELCEELSSSRSSGAPSVNFWDKPFPVAECGLCGGSTGAFRKSVDGQWVHAFCAEWVLESTFRRGQVNPVEGMASLLKGIDVCCICRRKNGVCIKCSYGHCQSTFHPSCARSAGFYMTGKIGSGRLQHKAYCEKHSLEQRAKAETQKHGIEELKHMKQTRVELERLRLLCERIIKREKLKRELVLCSHEILACKRDHVTRSVLVHSPFFPPEVSSESATTSLKGHTLSYSEAIQRSDDVTVDSTLSVKHGMKVPVSMDTDQRTDDSSTSQHLFTRRPEMVPFSGKQIPHKYSLAARNILDSGEWSSKSRKHVETFEKELIMTSDEASMKNSRLPKGYCYVPVDRLPKEKQISNCSGEQVEHNE